MPRLPGSATIMLNTSRSAKSKLEMMPLNRLTQPRSPIACLAAALCLVSAGILLFLPVQAKEAQSQVIASFDFTGREEGNAIPWLRQQGFEFKLEAEEINPRFEDNSLVLETEEQKAGLIARPVEISDADRVRITWGVNDYPEGADWDAGVYRVPIAVMISFGDRTIESGSLIVPDAPYFVGLFLGQHEQEGRAYKAQYYNKGGRYFCQPCNPATDETVTTVFDFEPVLKQQFEVSPELPVTNVGIQMNTTDTRGGARAFVKKIEFLADQDTGDVAEWTPPD